MQLLQAIQAWSAQHGSRLSDSTKSDIAEIVESIERCGFSDWAAEDIDEARRAMIAEQTAGSVSLSHAAIGEFVTVVTTWAAKQPASAFEPSSPSAFQDSLHALESDDVSGDHDDEYDDKEYDDDDEYDDNEYDDDDEYDDDSGEVAVVVGVGASALDPQPEDEAAASSFFATIGKSPLASVEDESAPSGHGDAEFGLAGAPTMTIETEPRGGIFSTAAEEVPARKGSRIDWITLAYFTVAAICFALALYFYFSKS